MPDSVKQPLSSGSSISSKARGNNYAIESFSQRQRMNNKPVPAPILTQKAQRLKKPEIQIDSGSTATIEFLSPKFDLRLKTPKTTKRIVLRKPKGLGSNDDEMAFKLSPIQLLPPLTEIYLRKDSEKKKAEEDESNRALVVSGQSSLQLPLPLSPSTLFNPKANDESGYTISKSIRGKLRRRLTERKSSKKEIETSCEDKDKCSVSDNISKVLSLKKIDRLFVRIKELSRKPSFVQKKPYKEKSNDSR
ncbi:hypothetical protein BY996DRAFT_6583925 [Phakopsora pachyrhizi]|uniref:Expressed protein n=1 Tax=Phakopsora pachyrhizi TaxID=170000 RepID=A0AAV0BQ66_PHAPC|nr:hypothetical protein BY996DRAFT_6535901 [Phakopsora pachyrhizi]KAI8448383.1 hypothetical protein BY996DRAFT_6583925 [Phakopsora pachyrhizi]CAH7689494.1 expressed protein [Phakopsora pachyrhizi]